MLDNPQEADGFAQISVPIIVDGQPLAWLYAEPTHDDHVMAPLLVKAWAKLIESVLREQRISENLTNELIVAWDRLSFLNEIPQLVGASTDHWEISLKALHLAMGVIGAENAFIAQSSGKSLDFRWVIPAYNEQIHRQIIQRLENTERLVILNSLQSRIGTFPLMEGVQRFIGKKLQPASAPLTFVGLINYTAHAPFSAGDLQIVESLVEMLRSVSETAALQEERLKAIQLNQELEIAVQVQTSFLPAELPIIPGYELASALISASKIGGDIYDIFHTGQDHDLAILLCDVAGKGISGALLASSVRAVVRSELRTNSEPGKVLQQTNATLFDDMSRSERFATAMFLRSALDSSHWAYANAGHTNGLWIQADPLRVQQLSSQTLPLGIMPEIEDITVDLEMQPQDVLVIYSDGLTETEDEHGKLLGMRGAIQALLATHTAPAQYILESLIEVAYQHRGNRTLEDDLTLIVLRRSKPGEASEVLHRIRWHFHSDLAVLAAIEQDLTQFTAYLPEGIESTWLIEIQLAVTEAITNIILHAYADSSGSINGLVTLFSDKLVIDLCDSGKPYDARPIVPLEFDPENPPEGGYGVHLIHQIMDEVIYERLDGGYNHWQLTRLIR